VACPPNQLKKWWARRQERLCPPYGLSEISGRNSNRALVRPLAVLKLWNSGGPGLDYGRFVERVRGGGDYDIAELTNLLRKDQKPDANEIIRRVVEGFRFLADLTESEKLLAADAQRKKETEAQTLIASLQLATRSM
jgi:hypothetical protein